MCTTPQSQTGAARSAMSATTHREMVQRPIKLLDALQVGLHFHCSILGDGVIAVAVGDNGKALALHSHSLNIHTHRREVRRLVAAQLVAGGGNCEPYRGQDFRASIPVDEGALASRVVAHNHDSDLLGGVAHARP